MLVVCVCLAVLWIYIVHTYQGDPDLEHIYVLNIENFVLIGAEQHIGLHNWELLLCIVLAKPSYKNNVRNK